MNGDVMKRFAPLKILFCIMMGLVLARCQQTALSSPLTPPGFTEKPALTLNVASIDIVEEYQPTFHAPYVEHLFSTTPAQGIRIWANDRLRASGTAGRLEIIIHDASVKEVPLPRTQGLKGFFTSDQSERYDGRIQVSMRLYDGVKVMSAAEVEAEITQSRSIGEDATLAERERLFNELNKEMLARMDQELEQNMRQYFGSYLMAQ